MTRQAGAGVIPSAAYVIPSAARDLLSPRRIPPPGENDAEGVSEL